MFSVKLCYWELLLFCRDGITGSGTGHALFGDELPVYPDISRFRHH